VFVSVFVFKDILIYDEERDLHVRITWKEAWDACCIDNLADGNLVEDGNGGKLTRTEWKTAARAWDDMNTGGYKKATAAGLDKVSIMICRPFIEHLMSSAILTVGGRDTGATLFGPAGTRLPTPLACTRLHPFAFG